MAQQNVNSDSSVQPSSDNITNINNGEYYIIENENSIRTNKFWILIKGHTERRNSFFIQTKAGKTTSNHKTYSKVIQMTQAQHHQK